MNENLFWAASSATLIFSPLIRWSSRQAGEQMPVISPRSCWLTGIITSCVIPWTYWLRWNRGPSSFVQTQPGITRTLAWWEEEKVQAIAQVAPLKPSWIGQIELHHKSSDYQANRMSMGRKQTRTAVRKCPRLFFCAASRQISGQRPKLRASKLFAPITTGNRPQLGRSLAFTLPSPCWFTLRKKKSDSSLSFINYLTYYSLANPLHCFLVTSPVFTKETR